MVRKDSDCFVPGGSLCPLSKHACTCVHTHVYVHVHAHTHRYMLHTRYRLPITPAWEAAMTAFRKWYALLDPQMGGQDTDPP